MVLDIVGKLFSTNLFFLICSQKHPKRFGYSDISNFVVLKEFCPFISTY